MKSVTRKVEFGGMIHALAFGLTIKSTQ